MTAVIPDAEGQGHAWVIVRQGSMAMGDPQYWSSSHGWGPIGQADTHNIHEVGLGDGYAMPTDGIWARVRIAKAIFGF